MKERSRCRSASANPEWVPRHRLSVSTWRSHQPPSCSALSHKTARSANPVAATRHPFRSLIGLLLCAAGLFWLISTYSRDIVRDHLLHGTWQPAYDLRATDGKCSRTNFVLTTCTANIKSVASPDQAPISVSFMMLFSGGGGEVLIPVRSTKDRAAVSIHYSAETKLWNRTLSFVFFVCATALFGVIALFSLLRAVKT